MKILTLFSKPEKAPFPQGSIEVQVSNLRLDIVARGVNELYRAFNDMGAEDPAKIMQNEKAAEVLQGAVQLVRNDERTATVVKAIAHTEVVPVLAESNTSPDTSPERSPEENNPQPPQVSTDRSPEAYLAEAQANVAAALLKAEQKK